MLPGRLFSDYSATGSLSVILAALQEHKAANEVAQFDWSSTESTGNAKAFADVVAAITQKKMYKERKVFIDAAIDAAAAAKLKEVVKAQGGELVDQASACTHHVMPDASAEEDDGDYCRTIEINGQAGQSLVHWWYHPDSYDVWLASSEIQGEAEPDALPDGAWKLHARWIRDTAKFNEWMNEMDYEADEESEEPNSKKRKREEDSRVQQHGVAVSRPTDPTLTNLSNLSKASQGTPNDLKNASKFN